MYCDVATTEWDRVEAEWLVVPVPQDTDFSPRLAALNEATGGFLGRLVEGEEFTGKVDEVLVLHEPSGVTADRLLLVGLGKGEAGEKGISRPRLTRAVQTAARRASEKQTDHVAFVCPESAVDQMGHAAVIETIVTALSIGCVGQGHYHSDPQRHTFANVTVVTPSEVDASVADNAVHRGRIIGEAVNFTRELVNRPANEIYPESVAETAEHVAHEIGLLHETLDENGLKHERMGSMLAVGIGSDRPPRLVVLRHQGNANADAPTLALVGKGVTFDSGGLSLKPSDGMITMKGDMAGAATVLGVMAAVARLKLPVNVTGYLGLAENMVSGRSYKLGDVLHARNGVTIEVHNTDAEGRLVLADCLAYAADQGATHIVDLATLTGACVVALGEDVSGLFTNDQTWADRVMTSCRTTGEDVWQLPMHESYAEQLKSDVADCKNVGTRWGGAITAAKFLEKFVDDKPWVHLDIAGPSFAGKNAAHREGGATGCMVQALVELASNYGR